MKKLGRPALPTGRKKIKASSMLAPRLMDEAKDMAESMEITLSEFIAEAIKQKVEALSESANVVSSLHSLPAPTKRTEKKSAK